MRRLSPDKAAPGMVLGRPVLDSSGKVICADGEPLQKSTLSKISIYGIDELLIEDASTADVPVEPLLGPELEAQAAQGLRQAMTEGAGLDLMPDALLNQVIQPVTEMTRRLFPVALGEPNTAPCYATADRIFRLPARAAGLSIYLAAKAGLDQETAQAAGVATMLMDLGFLRLPKPAVEAGPDGPGTGHEFKKHPVHGYVLLRESQVVRSDVKVAVLEHHERLDGSGYPRGLKKAEVGKLARIVAIPETYFDLISPGAGRKAVTRHEAIEYVRAFAGDLFDRELAAVFARNVPPYPAGVMVSLNTGERGVVIDSNIGHIGRPVVRLLFDDRGYEMKQAKDIDLSSPDQGERYVAGTPEY